jgi:hypothetical protein
MAALVRLIIGEQTAKTVRLPELPAPGELIQLADGTRVIVGNVEPLTGGNVDAEVLAKPSP